MNEIESAVYYRIRDAFVALQKGDLSVHDELVKTLEESKRIKFDLGELQSLAVLSIFHSFKTQLEEAIYYEKQALAISIKINNKEKEASSYNALAGYYFKTGEKKKGIDFYMKGLKIYDDLNNDVMKARIQNSLGTRFISMKDYVKAEQYFLASWNISKYEENQSENWNVLNELAQLYFELNNKEKTNYYLDLAYKNAKQFNHPIGLSFVYRTKAEIEQKKSNHEKAIYYIDKSLKKLDETGVDVVRMYLIILKAKNLNSLNQLELAKQLLLDHFDKVKQDEKLMEMHEILFSIYQKEGDYKEALKHHLLYIEWKEKLENIETEKHIRTTEARFQNQIKENEKEILRLQKTEMEQKALRAQLNPHFFFNSLNSVNKFILDNDAENASKFLANFSSLMRKTLENSEESLITIEDEVEYLEQYLKLEQLRLDFSFQFEININEDIEEDFIKIPTMMLQPYVENAIKHGINGVENGLIKVSFELKDDENIICIIEDNGKGRGGSSSNHKSMGTSILENRVRALNTKENLKFSIDIQDLKNHDHTNAGTRIFLNIPIV